MRWYDKKEKSNEQLFLFFWSNLNEQLFRTDLTFLV